MGMVVKTPLDFGVKAKVNQDKVPTLYRLDLWLILVLV